MNLASAIKEMAIRGERIYLALCTVDKVDEEGRMIDCTSADEVELRFVQLQAGLEGETGIVMFPKVGSEVIVGFLDRNNAVVLVYSEIDRVRLKIGEQALLVNADGFVFNEGENGGLVNIETLTERINRLEDKLKSHQHGYIPYPGGSAGPSVLTTPATAATPPDTTLVFANTKQSDIEDLKVTH
jgi:hypothetical protein